MKKLKNHILASLLMFSSLGFTQTYSQTESEEDKTETDFGEFKIKKNKYGLVKKDGTILIPFKYDSLSGDIEKGHIKAIKKRQTGIINRFNKIIIPFEYEDLEFIKPYSYAFLKTKIKNKYGVINYQGQKIIENNFDVIKWHEKGFFVVKIDGKIGAIDKKGKVLLDNVNGNDIHSPIWKNNLMEYFIFQSEGGFGLVHNSGKISIPPNYTKLVFWEKENVFYAENSLLKKGLLSLENKTLLPIIYDHIVFDTPEFILVQKNKKYGVVDIKNNVVVPFEYDVLYNVSSKKCISRQIGIKNNKSSIFDSNGLLLTELEYDIITPIDYCFFETTIKNKLGLINVHGKSVLQNKYNSIQIINDKRIIASENINFVLFDIDGKLICKKEFEYIKSINSPNYLSFKKNNKYGLIDYNGELIIEPTYDKIYSKRNSKDNFIYGKISGKKRTIMSDKK